MRENFGNDFMQEVVVDGNIAASKLVWEHFLPEARLGFVSRTITRDDLNLRLGRQVVRKSEEREARPGIRLTGWEAWKEVRSRLDSRNIDVFRDAIHDHVATALVDVMLTSENL